MTSSQHSTSHNPSSVEEWRASRQPTVEEVEDHPAGTEHHNPDRAAINRLHNPAQFKKLKMIAYQAELQILVCVSCGIGIRCCNVHGHLRKQHHIALSLGDVHDALSSSGLTFVDDEAPVIPPPGRIAPIPWLLPAKMGKNCVECNYCAEREGSFTQHFKDAHPNKRDGRKVGQLWQSADMQRLFSTKRSSTYFRVDKALQGVSAESRFASFYASLPGAWQTGDFAGSASDFANDTAEFDLTPFLANTGWVCAIKGYSVRRLRAQAFPAGDQDEPYMHAIKGLGDEFLSSVMNLNNVHPTITEGLTKWRTRQ